VFFRRIETNNIQGSFHGRVGLDTCTATNAVRCKCTPSTNASGLHLDKLDATLDQRRTFDNRPSSLRLHHLEEFAKDFVRIMRTRRRFWVELHAQDRSIFKAQPFE
jgi:hypothetical protein